MVGGGGRRYRDELRERAVRLVVEIRREGGKSHGVITRVARELGVGAESVRGWMNRAEIDSGTRPGTSPIDSERIARLERANTELRPATTARRVRWMSVVAGRRSSFDRLEGSPRDKECEQGGGFGGEGDGGLGRRVPTGLFESEEADGS